MEPMPMQMGQIQMMRQGLKAQTFCYTKYSFQFYQSHTLIIYTFRLVGALKSGPQVREGPLDLYVQAKEFIALII